MPLLGKGKGRSPSKSPTRKESIQLIESFASQLEEADVPPAGALFVPAAAPALPAPSGSMGAERSMSDDLEPLLMSVEADVDGLRVAIDDYREAEAVANPSPVRRVILRASQAARESSADHR